MSLALTSGLDVAQVVLYVFWAFFFSLVYWLRKEDRREGYPLETDITRRVSPKVQVLLPKPKTFLLPHGGEAKQPNFVRDTREIQGERHGPSAGTTLEPVGDPMLSGIGPASYAERADEPELTREGHDLIVPLRVAEGFAISAGPDPRGWDVVATDGEVAGTVKDLWVDRADVMVRYLEVALTGEEDTRLLPIAMLRLRAEPKKVEVYALRAAHFPSVPKLKQPDRVTLMEEERISAFYAGGRLYGEPKRMGPVL
jgi:photosynthetic reaction center H subunit